MPLLVPWIKSSVGACQLYLYVQGSIPFQYTINYILVLCLSFGKNKTEEKHLYFVFWIQIFLKLGVVF